MHEKKEKKGSALKLIESQVATFSTLAKELLKRNLIGRKEGKGRGKHA